MTDRELLELAAKVAGMIPDEFKSNEYFMDGLLTRWNPLDDNGYALRLAITLGIGLCFHQGWAQAMHPSFEERIDFYYGDDPAADVRRAIVRAAADIGMKAS